MKILLNQRFGLGNQLFQYAAGLYFARKYNASLEIIREHEEKAVSYGHARPFLLSNFSITTPVRDRTLADRVLRSKSKPVALAAAPIRRLLGAQSHDPNFLIVGEFRPSIALVRGTRRVYLNGHFQAHQYADSVEEQLRREFAFRHPATGKNLETLTQILNSGCPVSIHVRLGDYTLEWNGKNLLPATYYENAISAISATFPNATFFVFSDDIAAARKRLPMLEQAIFVDNNGEDAAHEDLRLMSACRHHILANSTFSWWGAWLNPNPDKTVLVPDPWHRSNPHPDLLPEAWRRIPVEAPAASPQPEAVSAR